MRIVPLPILFALCSCAGSSDKGPQTPPSTSSAAPVRAELFVRAPPDPAAVQAERVKKKQERDERWQGLAQTLKKEPVDVLWARAQQEAEAHNWKDAQSALTALVVHHGSDARALSATQQAMLTAFRLGEYGDGLGFAEDALLGLGDPLQQARLARVLGNAYLAVPHWGTTRGGEFLRGRADQGKQTQTHREDRARAIALLEQARTAWQQADPTTDDKLRKERLEAQIDLASAVARFTWFDSAWHYWWYAWGEEADDGLADADGDDEFAGKGSSGRHFGGHGGWWGAELQRAQPRGLEVAQNGQVLFVPMPESYAAELDDTAKIKFLLAEVERLDQDPHKSLAARALMLRALLFRTRDGSERLERLSQWWWQGTSPYKKQVEGRSLHELQDDEVLGLIATHIGVYRVPDDESVPKLLSRLAGQYPDSDEGHKAMLQLGLFHQSRGQYQKALTVFQRALSERPDHKHTVEIQGAIDVIERRDLQFIDGGVQPAGKKAVLKVRSRNLEQVKFRARRIDLEGALQRFQHAWREGGSRSQDGWDYSPDNLMYLLLSDDSRTHALHTSDVVEFTAPLKRDGGHRFAEDSVQTTIDKPGLWLVDVPGEKDLNRARGLVLLEDMAVVHKQTKEGPITWVLDARTGKPLPNIAVEMFAYWSDWKQDKETRHSKKELVKTDSQGIARHAHQDRQVLVTARSGNRIAIPPTNGSAVATRRAIHPMRDAMPC